MGLKDNYAHLEMGSRLTQVCNNIININKNECTLFYKRLFIIGLQAYEEVRGDVRSCMPV